MIQRHMLLIMVLALVLSCAGCVSSDTDPGKAPTATPTPTATPSPSPAPSVTPEPTSSPVDNDTVNTTASSNQTVLDDNSFASFVQQEEWDRLFGQTPNMPASSTGLAGDDQTQTSPYPWIRYGYQDQLPANMSFMWSHDHFMTVANSESERYTLYDRWLQSITPHHDVQVELHPLNFDPDHDAIINGTLVGGSITLTNKLPDDPIARVDAEVKFYRYNAQQESYIEIPEYGFSVIGYELGLIPGQPWTYTVRRTLQVLTGSYMMTVKIWDHDDGIMLCQASAKGDVANDYGGGIISFG